MSDSFLLLRFRSARLLAFGWPASAPPFLGITPVALRAPYVIPKNETAESFCQTTKKQFTQKMLQRLFPGYDSDHLVA